MKGDSQAIIGTQILSIEEMTFDNRKIFGGAPNSGVIAGPEHSPDLAAALKED